MSESIDVLKWRFLRRKLISKNVLGFNAHILTYASRNCSFNEYNHLLKGSVVRNSNLSRFTRVSGGVLNNVEVGAFSAIATRTFVGGGGEHPTNQISTHSVFYKSSKYQHPKIRFTDVDLYDDYPKRVHIGNDVWIGSDCFIKPGVVIGTGAIVAAGSIVVKNVPPYAIVGGVPAKVIKYRFSERLIELLITSRWWDWEVDKLRLLSKFSDFETELTENKWFEILDNISSERGDE